MKASISAVPVRLYLRLIVLALTIVLLVVPGYFAARATESIAVGILAGDLAFLISVAGWASFAGGARR